MEGKEQYCGEIKNKLTALKNVEADIDININSAWETIREHIKISAKKSLGYDELKKHMPRMDVQIFWIKGNKPNCSGYKIQAK
jgi:hypothetical protein